MTVPRSKGRTTKAAVEDVRHAIIDDELAMAVPEAIEELAVHLETAIDRIVDDCSG